jgi:hypothetical protein
MTNKKTFQARHLLPVILTLIGVLIGILLSVLAVWADLEATTYGFVKRAQTPFRGLSCPIFMGKNESRVVSVKVSNPTDQTLSPSVRTEISTPMVLDYKLEFLRLAPGEQVIQRRSVGPDNIDLGRFIFVKVLVYSAYPLPNQENTCGIFVLPFPGSGSLILTVGTTLSILLMSTGLFLLHRNGGGIRQPRSLVFTAVVTVLAMLFGFIGWWMQAIILLVILILMLVISLTILVR